MSNVTKLTVVVAVLALFLISPAYAELIGSARDVGRAGLEAIVDGLYALAVGIAVAGIAIGVGLKMQKK